MVQHRSSARHPRHVDGIERGIGRGIERGIDRSAAGLVSAVLSTLPRRDQQRRGVEYVHGLMAADGRKSVRNIAKLVDGRATEQSLHHFVSDSTWDWSPMRQCLADLAQRTAPSAWVVQSLSIPKKGEHSVGVDHQLVAETGEPQDGQRAFGMWCASPQLSVPVNWRLFLPTTWLDDTDRRSRAAIPEHAEAETLEQCAVATVLESLNDWELPARPVLMDARAAELRCAMPALAGAGIPLLARISGAERVSVTDRALRGHASKALPAERIVSSAKRLARPVHPVESADAVTARGLVVSVRVSVPDMAHILPRGQDLRLVGLWRPGERAPQVWLTTMSVDPAQLMRLFPLMDRVWQDFAAVGDRMGLRDYEGRSFPGWHRHMTMASVAHAAAMIGAACDRHAEHAAHRDATHRDGARGYPGGAGRGSECRWCKVCRMRCNRSATWISSAAEGLRQSAPSNSVIRSSRRDTVLA